MGEVTRVQSGALSQVSRADRAEIRRLMIVLSTDKKEGHIESAASKLLSLAGKNAANAILVQDELGEYIRTFTIKYPVSESDYDTRMSRLWHAFHTLADMYGRAKNLSHGNDQIAQKIKSGCIYVMKYVDSNAKNQYPPQVTAGAHNTLHNWKVPGYPYLVE